MYVKPGSAVRGRLMSSMGAEMLRCRCGMPVIRRSAWSAGRLRHCGLVPAAFDENLRVRV
eukprot:scaffold37208_cov46-Prasinocladus_malaysianus.AAC.1